MLISKFTFSLLVLLAVYESIAGQQALNPIAVLQALNPIAGQQALNPIAGE